VTEDSKPSFWVTVPGMLAAVAAVITALTGVVVAANSGGGGGGDVASEVTTSSVAPADSTSASSGVTSSSASGSSAASSSGSAASGEGDALAGTWTGQAQKPGTEPYRIRLQISTPCWLTEPCGTIYVSDTPCWGDVSLKGVRGRVFELNVDRFTGRSGKGCFTGAGEFFEPRDDGTLRYTTDYDAVGLLHKVG
jgi:hypothetical protein